MGLVRHHDDIFERWLEALASMGTESPDEVSTSDAVARCRHLLEQLKHLYHDRLGGAAEAPRPPQIDEHRAHLEELGAILAAVDTIDAAEPEAPERVLAVRTRLTAFFERVEVYGPMSRAGFERIFEGTRQVHRAVQQTKGVMEQFRAHLSEGLATERGEGRTQLEEDIKSFGEISESSDRYAAGVLEFKAQRDEAELRWRRFQELHAAVMIQGRYRPSLQDVDRFLLAPEQEELVTMNYAGALRLQGSSGSGKTIILLHRALRLADEDPSKTVRVFTLNRSLARWLESTLDALAGIIPDNLQVSAFYDFLLEVTQLFQSVERYRLVDDRSGERIESSWGDFFHHASPDPEVNVFASEPVRRVIESVGNHRNQQVNAEEYLRQETVYVQSAFRRPLRPEYLTARRQSRGIPLRDSQRQACLQIVEAWEEWLAAGGLCDIDGLTVEAAEHFADPERLQRIQERFPTGAVLVDEMQDFSTLELEILRALVPDPGGDNRFFLAGDLNQKVFPKHHDTVRAGFNFATGGRGRIIRKNYRNTRQVLEAAVLLSQAYPAMEDRQDLGKVQDPELSHYEGGLPVVLECTPDNHLNRVMKIVLMRPRSRIVVISEDDAFRDRVAEQASELGIQPYTLLRNADLDLWKDQGDALSARLFLSRFESVKGFEFDTVIACDLSKGVVPSAGSPPEEYWRQAAVVYAALTRARDELIMTYVGQPSPFVETMRDRVDWVTTLDDDWMRRFIEPVG